MSEFHIGEARDGGRGPSRHGSGEGAAMKPRLATRDSRLGRAAEHCPFVLAVTQIIANDYDAAMEALVLVVRENCRLRQELVRVLERTPVTFVIAQERPVRRKGGVTP